MAVRPPPCRGISNSPNPKPPGPPEHLFTAQRKSISELIRRTVKEAFAGRPPRRTRDPITWHFTHVHCVTARAAETPYNNGSHR